MMLVQIIIALVVLGAVFAPFFCEIYTPEEVSEGRFLDLGDGRVHVVVLGKGKPVILIHGFMAWQGTFRKVAEILSKRGYMVIMPDLYGFGASERVRDAKYSLKFWAKEVMDVAESLGVKEAIVVGNSLGGAVALEVWRERPDFCKKLIAIAPLLDKRRIRTVKSAARLAAKVPFLVRWLAFWAYQNPLAVLVGRYLGTSNFKLAMEGYVKSLRCALVRGSGDALAAMGISDFDGFLGKTLDTEAIVIWGTDDRILPYDEEEVKRVLPRAKVIKVENGCHMLQEQMSELIVEVIETD